MSDYYTEVTKYFLSLPDSDDESVKSTVETKETTQTLSNNGMGTVAFLNQVDTETVVSSNSKSEWRSTISRDEPVLKKYRQEIEKISANLTYKPSIFKKGVLVFTFSKKIATKTLKPNNVRESRDKTMGTVVKRSEVFPDLFLVNFYYLKKYFYVTEDVIRYEAGTTPSLFFASSPKNQAIIKSKNQTSDNEEIIMSSILNAKIHLTPGHKDVTMQELYNIFQPTYQWLTIPKMNYCLAKAKKALVEEAQKQRANELKGQPSYANILMASKCNTRSSLTSKTIQGKLLHALVFHCVSKFIQLFTDWFLLLQPYVQTATKTFKKSCQAEKINTATKPSAVNNESNETSKTRKTINGESIVCVQLTFINEFYHIPAYIFFATIYFAIIHKAVRRMTKNAKKRASKEPISMECKYLLFFLLLFMCNTCH